MSDMKQDTQTLIRRSKLFIPANRERFIEKAWTRGADCINLDLEDAVAPADKSAARKMVKDVLPIVKKGGADVQVRINREFEAEDLDAVILPGLSGVVIPKCESAEEIRRIDEMITRLEKERGLPEGNIRLDLLIESAKGIIQVEQIVTSSPRIVQTNIGQADLAVDLGLTRLGELNFEQYVYAENKVRFAACSVGVQPCGLGAQNNVDFTNVTLGPDAMLAACRHAFHMGYRGALVIHPAWVKAANEGFKPSDSEIELNRKVKAALDDAYAKGQGAVSVEGRMYDMADMKHVDRLLERADALERKEAEKAAAVEAAGGIA